MSFQNVNDECFKMARIKDGVLEGALWREKYMLDWAGMYRGSLLPLWPNS